MNLNNSELEDEYRDMLSADLESQLQRVIEQGSYYLQEIPAQTQYTYYKTELMKFPTKLREADYEIE